MSEELKRMLMEVEAESLEDLEEIQDAIEGFTRLKLETIIGGNADNITEIMTSFLEDNNISVRHLRDFELSEMLCILDQIPESTKYSSKRARKEYQYKTLYLAVIKNLLRKSRKENYIVNKYMRINCLALNMLVRQTLSQDGRKIFASNIWYMNLSRKMERSGNLKISESTTIGDILDAVDEGCKRIWNPWNDIDEHTSKIEDLYRILNDIVIWPIKTMYPNLFNEVELYERYSNEGLCLNTEDDNNEIGAKIFS